MFLRQLFDADTSTYTYLLADEESRKALLIDPVRGQIERDLKLLADLGFTLEYALDTHVHADHVTGAGSLRERTGCKIVAGKSGPESANLRLGEGDVIELGSLRVRVMETPGHTDDSVSYLVDGQVFTGDALFVRGTGRTDFQNGSAVALYRSITDKIFSLPDDTVVWPGHDYKGHTQSTVGEERRLNPRIAGKSEAEFVAIMNDLKLPAPKHLHEAVPANREVGLGESPAEASGRFDEVSSSELDKLPHGVRIIDVREPHEFSGDLGHLPRAENVPTSALAQTAEAWDREGPLLMVCRSGRRSRAACEKLSDMGFSNVTNLAGGMMGYHERQAPRQAQAQ